MVAEATFIDVPVEGGELRVASWGSGPRTVLGIHGITASSVTLAPVARHLGSDWTLVAPDLRGRGASRLPGPFGLRTHAEDCARVLEHLGVSAAQVVGESMGAYVAVLLAASRPDLVEQLVLVDGGIPLPVPEGVEVGVLLEAMLGPSLARLRETFPSGDAYLDFWRDHPALSEDWNEDVEAFLRYDLEGEEPELRSRVSEEAVRADAEDTLDRDLIEGSLRRVQCPMRLLRAERNLQNAAPPLFPDEVVSVWRTELAQLTDELVEDTNHYTLAFGARGSKIIAERVAGAAEEP